MAQRRLHNANASGDPEYYSAAMRLIYGGLLLVVLLFFFMIAAGSGEYCKFDASPSLLLTPLKVIWAATVTDFAGDSWFVYAAFILLVANVTRKATRNKRHTTIALLVLAALPILELVVGFALSRPQC